MTASTTGTGARLRLLHYAPEPLERDDLLERVEDAHGLEATTAATRDDLDRLAGSAPFDGLLIGPLEADAALEALRELRAHPALEGAPAVVILAGDDAAPDALLEAGAYTCLPVAEATPRAIREALRLAAQHATVHREAHEHETILDALRRQDHVGVLRTAYDGSIIEANEAFAAFLGYRAEELTGRLLLDLGHPDERDDLRRRALTLRTPEGAPYRSEGRYLHRDGHTVWLESHVTVARRPDGRIREFVALDVDISERKHAQQALEEQNARFRAALRAANAYVFELDLVHPARSVAQGVRRVLGAVPPDARTTTDWWRSRIHPDDLAEFDRRHAEQLANHEPLCRMEYRVRHEDGSWIHVGDRRELVLDADGNPSKMFGVIIDRTERVHAEDALHHSEDRLREALDAAELGAWTYEVATDTLDWNPRMYALYGVPPGSVSTLEHYLALIHPGDRPTPEFVAALHRTSQGTVEHEFRIVRPGGEERWLQSWERLERNAEGEPIRVSGLNRDITERKRAQDAIRESEERLREAMEAAGAGSWKAIPATGEFIASDRALELHGLPPGTPLTNERAIAAVHPEDRPAVEAAARRTLETGEPFRLEHRVPQPDGSLRWIASQARRKLEGDQVALVGFVQDITERKRAEEALRESEERLRDAMEAAGAGTWKAIPAADEFIASDRALELHGLPPGTPLTNERAIAAVHPEDRPAIEAAVQRTLETGEPYRLEFRAPQPDGSTRWLLSQAQRKLEGDQVALVGFVQDITERKRAEEALVASEQRFRALANLAPTFIWTANARGVITFTSERWLEYTGLSREDNDRWPELVLHPDDRERCLAAWTHAVATGEDYAIEVRNRSRDGDYRWMETRAVPLRDEHGRVTSWFGTSMDIHDRRTTEAALRESEQRLRLAQEIAAVGSLVVDIPSRTVRWSPEASAIYDLTGEVTSADALILRIHPEDRVRAVAEMRATWEPGAPRTVGQGEYRIVRRDGSLRWIARRWRAFFEDGNTSARATHVLITVQDVTDRRRAEVELRDSEQRLQLALDVGALGTYTYDVEHDRVTLDARAMALYGFDQSEVTLETLVAARHPDDRAPSFERIRFGLDPARGGSNSGEYRVQLPDGSERWIQSRVAVTFEGEGPSRHPVRALVTLQDITERKRLEAAQHEFLAMASHELRNPLAALKGNAQLMLRRARFDEEGAQTIVDQADHLERLVRDLLDITLATAGQFQLRRSNVELVRLVQATIALQQRTTDRHRIALRRTPPTLRGFWDADRLQQILANLLSNAVKYSPQGGDIAIDIEPGTSEVRVSVEDHGVGIPPAEQDRIFRRFQRLQSHTGRVDGLGLGLDVTRALVEAHGGHIEVRSAAGRGSTFAFTLPLADTPTTEGAPVTPSPRAATPATAATTTTTAIEGAPGASSAPAPARRATPVPSTRARLLVVDDDPLIQQLLRAALEDDGYDVALADDGLQALDALEHQHYDLVVLDLMMPRLDGAGLLRALEERHRREGVRVLVVSAGHDATRRAEELGADAVVQKPFELARLLDAVRPLVATSTARSA